MYPDGQRRPEAGIGALAVAMLKLGLKEGAWAWLLGNGPDSAELWLDVCGIDSGYFHAQTRRVRDWRIAAKRPTGVT